MMNDSSFNMPEQGDIRKGIVLSISPKGILVDIGTKSVGEVLGVISERELGRTGSSVSANLSVGDEVLVYVVAPEDADGFVVLSLERARQEAERQWRRQRKEQLLATLQKGDIVEGVVRNLTNFGAFIDLGGTDGLIHLSELTWGHATHPSEVLQVGDTVSVYVLGVDQERGRIALSLKRLQPEPWSQVEEKYTVGQLVEAEIISLTDFGSFARVEEGVDGLVHVSELSDQPISHPRETVTVGEAVLLKILSIDAKRHRMALSRKQVDPFELIKWERERQQVLAGVEEPAQHIVWGQPEKVDARVAVQEVTIKDRETMAQLADKRPTLAAEPPPLSDQIVQEMEESLVLDTMVDMNPLLEVDLGRCRLEPLSGLEFDYSDLSEQLSAELYDKSLDRRLEWRAKAALSLQAAAVLHQLGYNLSNRQMRRYLCAYCNIKGDGYFAEKQYDASRTYYKETLRLLPREDSYAEGLASGLILRFLKTLVHVHRALMQSTDSRSFFLTAVAFKKPEPMDGVALGLVELATISFHYIKLVLEEGGLRIETEPSLLGRINESLRRILEQNGQAIGSDARLTVLLQKAASARTELSKALEVRLSELIANSYQLNRLHLLEIIFADLRSEGSSVLCSTDRATLARVYQVYEDLVKYVAQERFVDKKVYHGEIIKKIRHVHDAIHKTPTFYGKGLLDELLLVWRTTLSVEFCLESILTGSEYLDRVGQLAQVFEKLEALKNRIYDRTDREALEHLQRIYRDLLGYSNCESVKDKINAHERLNRHFEVGRELVLTRRTYLGVQYFIAILTQWQNILADDYQSFLTRTARKPTASGRKWTSSEEELLRVNYEGTSNLELAACLGRTEAAIAAKMRHMKLKRKMELSAEVQKEYWQNPYIVGPPVKSREMFFGREDIFDYVQRNLIGPFQHNTIVLHGRRRTGKSSILYQIERRDLLHPHITVLIDTQGLGRFTMPLLFYKMSSHVSKALQRSGIDIQLPPRPESTRDPFWGDPFWRFTEFLDDVERATPGRKLILMIDEFEKIQEEIKCGRLDVDLYDNFRHLIQHREDIGFILAGTMRMVDIVKDYLSPFFGSSLLRRISFLRKDEAIALIRKPIEEHIGYEDQSIERILTLTAGHPYFVQLTCQTLVNHLTYRKRKVVTPEDVDYILGDVLSAGEGQFIFEWTSDTSPLDRLMLSWLAPRIETEAGGYPVSEIEGVFSRLLAQPTFAKTTISETLGGLTDREIVNTRQDEVGFRVDLYRRWIRQNKDFSRVCKEERVDQSLFE